ncbi:hypothetical protein [Rhodococcus sp. X156]|uniref:hypothetical protein n=1 Tax=Rhodococcus sp. X156 TaxID=2499145 RepID=UPI003216972D
MDPETLKDAEKKVANLQDRYEPGARPTVVVPGTGGTVAGTAFADDVEGSGSSDSEESDSSGSDDSGSDAKETDAS